MGANNQLRARRSAAQVHGLNGVEREIRANDHNGNRQYLRDFTQAFRTYDHIINENQLHDMVAEADICLVADYHALPASQRFAADLLEHRAHVGDRPVVLGIETIFARDQHILDEWWRREISERELRRRIRFELDWGYEWDPFYQLLVTAREHGEAIYGLDCMPREDLRKIRARDRHAAHKIAQIRERHPTAAIMVLFGESHLAPGHLPRLVRQAMPSERVLTVLQNVDALYWRAAGEEQTKVEAVLVNNDVVCAFNTAPLEKYENYRLCLSRWREKENFDVTPTIYNLIEALVRFLGINRYSPHNGTQPKFLVDSLPEVQLLASHVRRCGGNKTKGRLPRVLPRRINSPEMQQRLSQRLEERGSVYLPEVNTLYVQNFQMVFAAEEAARFLHHACRGLPLRNGQHSVSDPADDFYARVLEDALAYFGSRLLNPERATPGRKALLSLHAVEEHFKRITEESERDLVAQEMGYQIGNHLYEKYLDASVSAGFARKLFLADLSKAGEARRICSALACDDLELITSH